MEPHPRLQTESQPQPDPEAPPRRRPTGRARERSAWRGTASRVGWRLLQAIPILIGIVTITFFLTRALGDPVAQIAGPLAGPEEIAEIKGALGLDKPLLEQYATYIGDLAQGDLGESLRTGRPVVDEIRERIGGTAELLVLGIIAATIWGVLIGALAAYLRRAGRIFQGIAVLGLSIPDFVIGLALALVFAFSLGWVPAPVGQISFIDAAPPQRTGGVVLDALLAGQWGVMWSGLGYLVLPVLTLGLAYGAPVARLTEALLRETRGKAYIEYAELTGLSRARVFRYTLRNALPAILTIVVVILGFLVGGIVLVEIVFSWGGLGQWAAQSILALDLPAIQGFVLLAGVFTLLLYLLLDIAYGLIDPRVRRL